MYLQGETFHQLLIFFFFLNKMKLSTIEYNNLICPFHIFRALKFTFLSFIFVVYFLFMYASTTATSNPLKISNVPSETSTLRNLIENMFTFK